ncbi:hypothetical protein ACLOJK_022570 [Asimina triloba]
MLGLGVPISMVAGIEDGAAESAYAERTLLICDEEETLPVGRISDLGLSSMMCHPRCCFLLAAENEEG